MPLSQLGIIKEMIKHQRKKSAKIFYLLLKDESPKYRTSDDTSV